nr:hypothetical protein [uncultured Treponema sp.]
MHRKSNINFIESYCYWCNKNNERVLSQKGLAMKLQEKGFKRMASNGTRYWLGMGVRLEWKQFNSQ